MESKHIKIGGGITKEITMGNDLPFTLIAGPCQLQDMDLAMKIAEYMKKLTDKLDIQYIFKASFDKANRNSVNGARGIGIDEGIKIFDRIRNELAIPVITDVHTEEQAENHFIGSLTGAAYVIYGYMTYVDLTAQNNFVYNGNNASHHMGSLRTLNYDYSVTLVPEKANLSQGVSATSKESIITKEVYWDE
mgnify:CR=1 FL=1